MSATLTQDDLQVIKVVEEKTGAKASDVIASDEEIVMIFPPGEAGKAIGKEGANLIKLREFFKKPVIVFNDANTPDEFIKKVLHKSKVVDIQMESEGKKAIITVDPETKGVAIGKQGANIKRLKMLMNRKFGFDDVKII